VQTPLVETSKQCTAPKVICAHRAFDVVVQCFNIQELELVQSNHNRHLTTLTDDKNILWNCHRKSHAHNIYVEPDSLSNSS